MILEVVFFCLRTLSGGRRRKALYARNVDSIFTNLLEVHVLNRSSDVGVVVQGTLDFVEQLACNRRNRNETVLALLHCNQGFTLVVNSGDGVYHNFVSNWSNLIPGLANSHTSHVDVVGAKILEPRVVASSLFRVRSISIDSTIRYVPHMCCTR